MINHRIHHKEDKAVELSPEILEKVREVISHYPEGKQKSALIPVLHIAQEESGGWLSVGLMDYVAGLLDIKPIEVYEVATFYSMFNLDPVGRFVIDVCRTGPCTICGGEEILGYLEKKLGIKTGETTPDGLFTLHAVECLGACGNAPVLQVNHDFAEHLTTEKVDELIQQLRTIAVEKQKPESRWAENFS